MEVTWDNLWTIEGLVAAGTIGLAVVTGVLAFATRRLAGLTRDEVRTLGEDVELSRNAVEGVQRQAESSEQQVAVANMTLEATFRPLLVNIPRHFALPGPGEERLDYVNGPTLSLTGENRVLVNAHESDTHMHFSMPVRNVGAGVAFIVTVGARTTADDWVGGDYSAGIVPPAEVARLKFSFPKSGAEAPSLTRLLSLGNFSVVITYKDLGGRLWETRLDVYKQMMGDGWYVRQAFVKAAGADDAEAVGSGAVLE